ncbi:MAG: metallophosphoesterase [Myxococcota bacterium]
MTTPASARIHDDIHGQLTHGIRLRRFAGPAAYVGALDHIRVVHLTDLHVGRVTPRKVHVAAMEMTNAQRPDLVVITGDFVCHSQAYLDELTSLMRMIQAPVYGVLGNHDHWSGAREVRRALRRGGVHMLDNVHTTVTVRGQKLQLVGIDDAYTGHARKAEATRGLDPRVPTLGLSHIAEEADALWQHGVSLVLSGHTHAGQVTVAKLHEFAIGKLAGHRYVHGLYGSRATGAGAVYVGAGIGASVIPFRIGERGKREVTVFELGMRPGDIHEHHAEQEPLPGRRPSEKVQARRAAFAARRRAKLDKRLRAR